MNKKGSLVSSLLKEFAAENNIEILIESEFGYAGRITTRSGRYSYYHVTKFDINNLGASAIAHDKAYAYSFLKQLGYPVPEGNTFFSDEWCKFLGSQKDKDAASAYAHQLEFPLIVKPNSESQGRGVHKVFNDASLRIALQRIFDETKDHVALVQELVNGTDYRIVVLGDEVLCAYRRKPLEVIGDGNRTIFELLKAKLEDFEFRGRNIMLKIDDPRIIEQLHQLDMDYETILPESQDVALLPNANLSSGGEAEDVTGQLHEDYRKMAIQLTKDMGLTFCGIDIMTPDQIDQPIGNYKIIEINSSPGLDYYAEAGKEQHEIVKKLYYKLFSYIVNT